jgi:hypothetical protein
MTQKHQKRKDNDAEKRRPNVVLITEKPGDDRAALLAQSYLQPTVQAAATVRAFNAAKDGDRPELMALIAELGKQTAVVKDGDLGRGEAMLLGQAHSLDAIFRNLARRAVNQET